LDSEETNKRFDDTWNKETVDCNDCELYWNNSCDGVKPCIINVKDSTKLCKLFIPTRKLDIPAELKILEELQDYQFKLMIGGWTVIALVLIGLIAVLDYKGVI